VQSVRDYRAHAQQDDVTMLVLRRNRWARALRPGARAG